VVDWLTLWLDASMGTQIAGCMFNMRVSIGHLYMIFAEMDCHADGQMFGCVDRLISC
jgi:hypothetical protein